VKIKDVEIFVVKHPLPAEFRPAWAPGMLLKEFEFVLTRITTDTGIVGIGVGGDYQTEIWASVQRVKQDLIGGDPFAVERFQRLLGSHTYSHGPPLACVELALWDIIGKACGEPVYRLLGGYQDKVETYVATGEVRDLERRIEDVKAWMREGFKVFKIRFHSQDPEEDVKVVQALRDNFGNKIGIIVDANQAYPSILYNNPEKLAPDFKWTSDLALRIGRKLQNLDVIFLEEPLHKNDLHGYALLTQSLDIPIAGGESELDPSRFRDLLEVGQMDIVQPDVVYTGMLVGKKVSALAEVYDRLCIPHTWSSGGLGLMANLQLVGAIPNCPYLEYPLEPPAWGIQTRDILLKTPILGDNGLVRIPDKPGLGIELNEEAFARYAVKIS
jgi:L-alanine-DL-glutamate epimerase-like enolase superfamily enzyme